MKKILILTAGFVIATTANAASINWAFQCATTYNGYDVYVANSSTYASLADVQADLLGSSGNSGSISGSRSGKASGAISGLEASKEYSFFYIIVKDGSYWATEKQTISTNAEDAGAATTSFATASGTTLLSGAPTGSFAVPEPTSGLLLLLGMAGLALKRKRA